jgi:hypothetical protein
MDKPQAFRPPPGPYLMANAVLLTLQEYGRPAGLWPLNIWVSYLQCSWRLKYERLLGHAWRPHAQWLLLFQDFCLDLVGSHSRVARTVIGLFAAGFSEESVEPVFLLAVGLSYTMTRLPLIGISHNLVLFIAMALVELL